MEHARAAVGEWHHGVLHGRRQRAGDLDVAREKAGERRRIGALAEDADVVGKADHSYGPVRCTDHAICRIRRAADAGDVRCGRTAGPCVPEMPLTPVSAPEMLSTPGPKNDTARTAVLANDAPSMPSPLREKPMTPGCVLAAPSTPARNPAGTGG